jgi:hypothetical protein
MENIIFEFKKKFKEFSNSSTKDDLESNFKIFLNTAFEKLDVVPRAEFEKQKDLLKKAKDRLTELEKNIDELLETKKRNN